MDEQTNIPATDSLSELDALKAQCEEYLAGWKRAQADYQNAKREAEREKNDFAKYANEKLLRDLLPALEQFTLALQYIPSTDNLPEAEQKTWKNWLVGINAVKSLWDQAAKATNLEAIPTSGAFDPNLHDAVGEEVSETVASGNIVRVLQGGWTLHGKVLQPARVIVAK